MEKFLEELKALRSKFETTDPFVFVNGLDQLIQKYSNKELQDKLHTDETEKRVNKFLTEDKTNEILRLMRRPEFKENEMLALFTLAETAYPEPDWSSPVPREILPVIKNKIKQYRDWSKTK